MNFEHSPLSIASKKRESVFLALGIFQKLYHSKVRLWASSYQKDTIDGMLGILSMNNSNKGNGRLQFYFEVFHLHSFFAWADVNERFVSQWPTTRRFSPEIFPFARTKMYLS